MAVPDTDQLEEIQLTLIEDASFLSGLWTTSEVLGYFNRRQSQFLKQTQIVAAFQLLDWTPGQPNHALPEDWIDTILARWFDTPSGRFSPLPISDTFELDHYSPETAL
ncbi:MAG TPA: hypothetical protein VIM84_07425, partial [Gemmatimonadales bacterium]